MTAGALDLTQEGTSVVRGQGDNCPPRARSRCPLTPIPERTSSPTGAAPTPKLHLEIRSPASHGTNAAGRRAGTQRYPGSRPVESAAIAGWGSDQNSLRLLAWSFIAFPTYEMSCCFTVLLPP